MKHLTILILLLLILTSCTNEKTHSVDNQANQIDSLKEKFVPILNGVWVLSTYIDEIEKTKSPLKSSEKLQDIVTLIINATIKSDSIEVGASLNNHEGYSFTTYFISGKKPNRLKTNIFDYGIQSGFYELGYEILNNQPHLYIYQYDMEGKSLQKKKFSKVLNSQDKNDASWGLQYIVNEKLFSGNFLLLDSTNNGTMITLKSDGTITGDPNLKDYYVFTDFGGGPETILDGIVFNRDEKNSSWFAFKIENDTTFLYTTIGDEEAGEILQIDKIKYKLVRK